MPHLLPSLLANKLKRLPQGSHQPSTLSASNDRVLTPALADEDIADEPRRSQRVRRPSLHKRESDEYQASSQGSSRPASPSEQGSTKKPKKYPFGKRGERPGRIKQPASNARATAHSSSPGKSFILKPLAAARSQLGDAHLAGQGRASDSVEVVRISKAEGIRQATAYLGVDASRLSTETLKRVLEEIAKGAEEDRSGPMEIEGGSAPALLQSARRVVLGSGHQPPAGGTTDDVPHPQGSNAQLDSAHSSRGPEGPYLEEPPDDNTATEPESEPEIVELGPGDSVSQQPLRARQSSPRPRSTTIPLILHSSRDPSPTNDIGEKSNTATIDESDEERSAAHARKRQRLQRSPSLELHLPRSITSAVQHRPQKRPPIRLPPLVPTPASGSAANSVWGLSKPPPTSDVGAVLAWAAQLAKQATTANQGVGTSLQASQADHPSGPLNVLARVLGDAHSRLLTSAPALPVKSRDYRPYPRHTDPVEDDAEILEAEAALALGRHLRPRNKPTLADFPGLPRHIASLTIPELLAKTCAEGAFEVFGTMDEWANAVYNDTWRRQLPDTPLVKAPRTLRALMVRRCSWFRGETRKRVQPHVPFYWAFTNPPRTPQDLRHNRKLATSLVPNGFHCQDPTTGEDPYEHPALRKCIAAALFWSQEALGVAYHEKFRPLPLATIAMVLTLVQHCIQEWKTGRYVKAGLDAPTQLKMYQSHMQGLLEYEKKAPTRLSTCQESWFWYCIRYAGASEDEEPYQTVVQADRIRPDTPTSDAGTQARTKGKARAMD